MCIRVCIHRTSAEHDKRFFAVLNPATGYTVLSPFQDPGSDFCESPCINRPSTSSQICPWHAGCCNFDEYDLCNEPQNCNMSVNYHHFLSKEAPSFSVGVLRVYMVDPSFLLHAARFFKTGVELNLGLRKLPELQSSLGRLPGSGLSDSGTAVNKASIASRWYHYQHIKLASAALLAQLAIYWDMKAESGLWPKRPGREPLPDMNMLNDSDAHLKIISVGNMDIVDTRGEWPHIFKQSPNFIESLSPDTNPNLLPWVPDPESGSYRAITDISYDSANTDALALAHSAVELIESRQEQLERRRSVPQTGQQRHGRGAHDYRQTPASHHDPLLSLTPTSPLESDPASNVTPRRRRRKLPRRYRKRGCRYSCRFPRPSSSKSCARRRLHETRSCSNKRDSFKVGARLDPSLDAEIYGDNKNQPSSISQSVTASVVRASVATDISSEQASSQIQA
ncbi:hypothetical protein F4859DRAFT_516528 [Xylaria cf. heliscus]|nr:hypothetical protein F4859DRAFT_516528 [Xylaria cf. heliscus]